MAAAALLTSVACAPALAQDRLIPGLSEAEEERAIFVLGNTLFALHHELAHAVIDQFDLNPPGRLEDAADAFATVALAPAGPDRTRARLLRAAADGWLLYAETGSIEDLTYVDQHRLDEDRFYRTACLLVGADPENMFEYALDVGLAPDRIDRCPDAFDAARKSWDNLLAPHRPKAGRLGSLGPGSRSLSVVWNAAPAEIEAIQLFLMSSGEIDAALARLEDRVRFRRPLSVAFSPCGRPAAIYAAAAGAITLCHELLATFDGLVQLDLELR